MVPWLKWSVDHIRTDLFLVIYQTYITVVCCVQPWLLNKLRKAKNAWRDRLQKRAKRSLIYMRQSVSSCRRNNLFLPVETYFLIWCYFYLPSKAFLLVFHIQQFCWWNYLKMIFFQCHFLYFGRHSSPTVIVSDEKSAIIYVIAFLCITWQFSLTAFQIFYLLFSAWQFNCRVMYLLPPSFPYFLSLSFLFFPLPSVFLPSFPLSLWGFQSFLRSISSFHYMWKPSGHYFINFVVSHLIPLLLFLQFTCVNHLLLYH